MAAAGADSAKSALLDEISSKAPQGIIIPPKGVREIIEKTAGYVHRNGPKFEERLRGNARTSFVNEDDPYYAYYHWRLEQVRAGQGSAISAGREIDAVGVSTQGREERKGPEPPEEFQFTARLPIITGRDQPVVKHTARFVGLNGRSNLTSIHQREVQNPQFDFLRSTHSLYPYFSHLVDEYSVLASGRTKEGAQAQQKRIAYLKEAVKDRGAIIARATKRADWTKHQQAQVVAKDEAEEQERIAYAQIDWHDFVVVETVVFDERDETADLPPPTSLNDLQSASLEQKAQMSLAPHRRIEEAMPGFDDAPLPHLKPNTAAPPVQPVLPGQPFFTPTPPAPYGAQPPPFHYPYQNDEASRANELQAAHERARAAQQAASANGPVKIRNDYVPRAQARQQAQDTHLCPNCGQLIPKDEIAEHMRIELLDPQWREQARVSQQRSLTTNLATADVANNLKRLASQRTDVFDPVTGGAISEEEAARRKRTELGAASATAGQDRPDVQEQIRQLHQKYKT